MWRITPVNKAYRSAGTVIVSVMSFVPLLLLAAFGLVETRQNLRQVSPIFLFALGYTAVHMVFVGTIRYRLPLEPFLIIFAAAGLSRLQLHCHRNGCILRYEKRAAKS